MDLRKLRKKQARYAIGLMSGTSCDGIDAALVRIKGTGREMAVKYLAFSTVPYPHDIRRRLLAPRMDAKEICLLNFELGGLFGQVANQMMEHARHEMLEVDFVACSGHTIAHIPSLDQPTFGTLQIGEPAVITEHCGVPVVSDFRQRDMVAGGQGAPLIPYADWALFNREGHTSALLNLGGIANITIVPPEFDEILAFDVGPSNMATDGAVRLVTAGRRQYDENGKMAAKGVVIDEFLEYLLEHPYYSKLPPKSTGREEFGPEVYLRDALASRSDRSQEDLIATVTTAVAYSIVRAFNRFVKPRYDVDRFIISGGGAHNKTLLKRIKQGLPGLPVRLSDTYGISVDAREAIAFAILGNETICDTPANVPGATGAEKQVVIGKITPP